MLLIIDEHIYFRKHDLDTQDSSLASVKIKLNKIWKVYTDQVDCILKLIGIIKKKMLSCLQIPF